MAYDKLTHDHLEHGEARAGFSRLQRELSEQGKDRVDDAIRAAVTHISQKHDLQYGMQGHHIDEAMHYLQNHYDARHELLPKERVVIERSFKNHFGIKEPPTLH